MSRTDQKIYCICSGNAENRKLKVSPTDLAENGNVIVTIEDHAENKKPAKHKAKKLMVCSRSRS
jgi:hypothetical protein